jgi:hypothetical protein
MREKCEKIIAHGINCFINRQLIYNLPEEIFADAGVMAIGVWQAKGHEGDEETRGLQMLGPRSAHVPCLLLAGSQSACLPLLSFCRLLFFSPPFACSSHIPVIACWRTRPSLLLDCQSYSVTGGSTAVP